METAIALSRAFKDRDHEKVTHPTGGLIFAMVVNFLMSTVVNILIDIHTTYILGQLHNMNKFADTNASFKYFKEGAEKGVVLCQVELAWYYLRGYGTTRDWQKSEYWYRIAADNGNDYAKHVINEMEKYKDSGCQECGCPWIISVESEVYDYEDGNFIRFETQQYCQACDQRYFTT